MKNITVIYCGGNKFKFHPALLQKMYSFNVIPSLLSFICFLLRLLWFTASWTLFWEIWPATLPRGRSTSRCWWPCLRLSFAVQRTCTWGTSTWLYHRWSVLMLFCYMSCSLLEISLYLITFIATNLTPRQWILWSTPSAAKRNSTRKTNLELLLQTTALQWVSRQTW